MIKSGYIYRNYEYCQKMFDSLDIIYCSFITFNEEGIIDPNSARNQKFIENIREYICPLMKSGIKVIVSVAPHNPWGIVMTDELKRRRFVKSIISFIDDLGFDGVDVDWEHPTTDEAHSFTLLSQELSRALKEKGKLLTCAITGGMWQVHFYDIENSAKYYDYINIMTYSMSNKGGLYQNALFPSTHFHNEIAKVGRTQDSCSISETVEIFRELGIRDNQMIFGVPFYGCCHYSVDWSKSRSVFYTEIIQLLVYSYFDDVAKVSYIYDGNNFISFESENSLLLKLDYIRNNNLGGVMFWEYGCDPSNILIEVIQLYGKTNLM